MADTLVGVLLGFIVLNLGIVVTRTVGLALPVLRLLTQQDGEVMSLVETELIVGIDVGIEIMYLGLCILSIGLTIVWHYIVSTIGIHLVIGNDAFVNQHVANLAGRQMIWQWVEASVVWVPLQSWSC